MGPKQNRSLSKKLDSIYYNPKNSGSYGGVQRLVKTARESGLKVSQREIEKYLRNQASYSLHKPARKNFRRNPTIVKGIDYQWQADLADMQSLSKHNTGVKYLLTVIDVFSKHAWVIPIKNKGTSEMVKAFIKLFKIASPRVPQKLQTDAGKEFLNKDVQKLLKQNGVHHFTSSSDKKAAIVERFNRTLKTRIWTYFTAKQTYTYINKLNDFVESYNNSYHRSIGRRPNEVTKKDEDRIWRRLYGKYQNCPSKLRIGQKVRVSKVKGDFEKGYVPNWTEEHFLIKNCTDESKPTCQLVDDLNEDIKGHWYQEELQPIEENRYLIEKVLKKRKVISGKTEYFVKWKGWPNKFNSWITEENIYPANK